MNNEDNGNTKNKEKESKTAVKETAAKLQDKAEDLASTAMDKTTGLSDEAKEQALDVTHRAVDEAKSRVATQKDAVAGELQGVAAALRETGKQLRQQDQPMFARYSNEVAGQVERVSSYLEDHDLDDIMHETEDFARKQPELFLGGAFTLGLLAARFLKSSAPVRSSSRDRNYNRNMAGYGGRFDDFDRYDEPGRIRRRYSNEPFGTGRPVERGVPRYPSDPYPQRYDSEAAEVAREDWTDEDNS